MELWEGMTVGQMGKLLLHCEEPDLRESWKNWISYINNNKKVDGTVFTKSELQVDKKARILNCQPKLPAAYFLGFVAAICGREKGTSLELDEAAAEYHLNDIFGASVPDWKTCLDRIVRGMDENSSGSSRDCWEDIWAHLDYGALRGTRTDLNTLLEEIEKINRELHNKKRSDEDSCTAERMFNPKSIEYFRETLNKWSKDSLEALCEKYSWMRRFPDSGLFREICGLLNNDVKQLVLTGAPGTGKTYIAREAARLLGAPLTEEQEEADEPYVLVPFHPSYDYTDFVEGLRPVEGRDGSPNFVRLDGHFKRFCRQAAEKNRKYHPEERGVDDPRRRYFFLIDEINRADLSKVFGELMFCLESDKRGERVQTQYQNLPVYRLSREEDIFAGGFFVPKNVCIIGTMNDIDRSVESMDFALRRRFLFLTVEVDEELLAGAFRSGSFGGLLQENAESAAERIMKVNAVISKQGEPFGLNEQYYISQGQFSGLPENLKSGDDLEALLEFVWKFRVKSLLEEYVRGEDERKVGAFLESCGEAFLSGTKQPEESGS